MFSRSLWNWFFSPLLLQISFFKITLYSRNYVIFSITLSLLFLFIKKIGYIIVCLNYSTKWNSFYSIFYFLRSIKRFHLCYLSPPLCLNILFNSLFSKYVIQTTFKVWLRVKQLNDKSMSNKEKKKKNRKMAAKHRRM